MYSGDYTGLLKHADVTPVICCKIPKDNADEYEWFNRAICVAQSRLAAERIYSIEKIQKVC